MDPRINLQMKSLKVEALIKKIQCIRSLMSKDKTKKLIIIMFAWFQHIAGTSLFSRKSSIYQTLKQCLDFRLHSIIKNVQCSIKTWTNQHTKNQRENDRLIIDDVHNYT